TAGAARVEGFDVCGKTGTAQVASKDKAGSKNKDHAWFISFAPREKPEICAVILTENAGFGGKQSAPRAKEIYEDYYRRTRGLDKEYVAGESTAENAKPAGTPEGAKAVVAKAAKPAGTPVGGAKNPR
ncbi:MAG TPA: penicillin-binding transpeptidase domain-containing protein, partial [Blastocatellia bacterium]|nr:penicillin-binding transpeptidase domain-containing protein [Blastocatellia bacterium]